MGQVAPVDNVVEVLVSATPVGFTGATPDAVVVPVVTGLGVEVVDGVLVLKTVVV